MCTGLTDFTLDLAFGLDASTDVGSYDYIADYQSDPTGQGATFWKVLSASQPRLQDTQCTQHAHSQPCVLQESTKVENVVTIGATLLSNTTDAYASFAVLIYQAFGRKVCPGLT